MQVLVMMTTLWVTCLISNNVYSDRVRTNDVKLIGIVVDSLQLIVECVEDKELKNCTIARKSPIL